MSDPQRLQILATEHWSLIAARQLTYSEALSRATIFLAVLSGSVVALALVAQADHFGPLFTAVAIPLLLVVVFVGLATVARLNALNRDDYRWVVAMNRIRRAYLDYAPDLEPYFTTGAHDDLPGVLLSLGIEPAGPPSALGSVFHLVHTLPGMIAVLVAAVFATAGALSAWAFGAPGPAVVLTAAICFAVFVVGLAFAGRRSFSGPPPSLRPRFPAE